MNLNLINLRPADWSKADWNYAYDAYCKTNMFGKKTKREYYDMVLANDAKQEKMRAPLSEDLQNAWLKGFRSSAAWAKKRKCNMNGVLLENCRPEINLEDLQNNVKDIQWELMQKRG